MNQETILTTSHVKFFREGRAFTVPTSGNASATARPGRADDGWIYLGALEQFVESNKPNVTVKVYGADPEGEEPGRKQMKNILRGKFERVLKLTTKEFSNTVLELLVRSGVQVASPGAIADYVPGGRSAIKGWIWLKQYNADNDTLIREEMLWCEVIIEEDVTWDGDDSAQFVLTCTQLLSALNSGGTSVDSES